MSFKYIIGTLKVMSRYLNRLHKLNHRVRLNGTHFSRQLLFVLLTPLPQLKYHVYVIMILVLTSIIVYINKLL